MMTAPDYRHHMLCPVCGVTTTIADTRVYVTCRERAVAENIAEQLAQIFARRHGKDLNEEELLMLRQRFAAWERQSGWS
ncbi:hypothetical protein [uncultured Methanospirillum sp.]|uniref:hypothetical protein n=1 Tax=uncultured Methanospirillum sp. TaxID=262503 RepID=UPI0029C787A2|nr:hypothetical protein [uncultured Methanospirillum sp.]